jgi:hypothetical protein
MERMALRVGEVAARAGVHRETLRYYERRGLIAPPPRRSSGYRQYPPETVERVRLIKWAQGLGCHGYLGITSAGERNRSGPARARRSARSTKRPAGSAP